MKTSNLIITVATVIVLCDTALAQVDHSGYTIYSGDSVRGRQCDDGVRGGAVADSTPCEDGDVCTSETGTPQTPDHCEAGQCVGIPVNCGPGDQCNDNVCNPATGACEAVVLVDCGPGDQCNDNVCNPATGDCGFVSKADSTPCENGDVCTSETGTPQTPDHCEAGQCVGIPVNCGPGDQCNDNVCNPATGACEAIPVDCSPLDDQCNVGVCNPDTGVCEQEPLPSPNPCEAQVDIKPGSCPNSFNRDSHGVLPVALVGTDAFDVSDVDLSSVSLSRADGVGGSLSPHEGPPGPHSVLADTATPFGGELCDCHELTGDGITDLSMKFKTDDLVAALDMDDFSPGALVELTVSGNLLDGTPFSASDCVRLVPPGAPLGLLAVQSNLSESWIDVSPLDLQLDGGGFGSFDRTWPLSTLVTFTAEETTEGLRFVGWKQGGQFVSTALSIDRTVEGETDMVEAAYAKAADLTGDGRVDLTDFAQFALCFGSNLADTEGPCSNEMLAASDLNRDGEISLFDFGLFASLFGH